MSDELSEILQSVKVQERPKDDDPDQRVIEAMAKALKATTTEYAGCPWDKTKEDEKAERPGIWIPGY